MSKTPAITYHTLDNGLRVVHRHVKNSAVDFCGVIVRVGSRNEADNEYGLAHFVEHTIFKGTQRRSSWHIINRMESVGGELNAYTTKEETVVYTCAPAGNLTRSVELLSDLIANSRFPDAQLDKEREVVADEIDSYLDSPADAVFDEFEDIIFANTPLGHNILGTKSSIESFNSQTCREYLRKWYVPGNMVTFYAGAKSPDRVFATMQRFYGGFSGEMPLHNTNLQTIYNCKHFDIERNIGSHQTHTILGNITHGLYSQERFALALLTNILGGPGMNSLLNLALRERRGLVYTVEASSSLFTDCGLLTIYFGCDPDDTSRCIELVRNQIEQLADTPMGARRLDMAKKQYIGQLAVASENAENTTLGIARATMLYGQASTPRLTAERIKNVTAAEICTAAASLLPLNRLSLI